VINHNKLVLSLGAAFAVVLGAGAWLSYSTPAQAGTVKGGTVPVLQQVGYAGQLDASVTGQLPVTFRLFAAGDRLAYEETITADIHKGQFQVFVGNTVGDLRTVLKDSQQMKVFFQGNLVDTVSVVHANRADVLNNPKQFAGQHAVIVTDETTAPGAATSAIAGTCFILNSGFFTVPFTNTTVGTSTPGCGSAVSVAGGYSFLTTPSQGVIAFGLFPVVVTNWQVNYQVAGTPATLQTTSFCCI
jgi:hypothetical protein